MILSHRGFWLLKEEQNTLAAFKRSLENGFGIETDIRDYSSKLVISHDFPNNESLLVESFFEFYKSQKNGEKLIALNIKSDGLQNELFALLESYEIRNYFVFDMSVPDALLYLKKGITSFTRESEYEAQPSFYEEAEGVWIDEFNGPWISLDDIQKHRKNGKVAAIVSPELHKRSHINEWKKYKSLTNLAKDENIHLCTDFPLEAKKFFND